MKGERRGRKKERKKGLTLSAKPSGKEPPYPT
jgi:hypothetical protein